jgi:hypothetical protein
MSRDKITITGMEFYYDEKSKKTVGATFFQISSGSRFYDHIMSPEDYKPREDMNKREQSLVDAVEDVRKKLAGEPETCINSEIISACEEALQMLANGYAWEDDPDRIQRIQEAIKKAKG